MGRPVTAINSEVLRWARVRAGLTVADVAKHLHKTPEVVTAWESGSGQMPTYVQMEKLAYELFKRPIAIFFFPDPPDEPAVEHEFRLIPDAEVEALGADSRLAIRQARAAQESLRELTGGRNPAPRRLIDTVDPGRFRTTAGLAERVRKALGVSLGIQASWGSVDDAFKEWRSAVEACGVFVFKRAFKDKGVSGFCLYDPELPVIYVNNSAAHSRQVFTLFHELAHLLYRASGITKVDDEYVSDLSAHDRKIEQRCNEFAGALLVPEADFVARSSGMSVSESEIAYLANIYSVSREVILRRFFDLGTIDQAYYEKHRQRWIREWERRREKRKSGGDYYRTQAVYLSKAYTKLAFNSYYEGKSSVQALGEYLGIKAKNVPTFEAYLAAG